MTTPRRNTPHTSSRGRRSPARSMRKIVAILLLLTALGAGIAAIVVGSPALVPGVVVAIVAAAVSARLLSDETTRVRRDWARDRAALAHQQTREATARAREHTAFAEHMAGAVRAGRAEAERLLAELATAATSLAEAEQAYAEAARRGDRLESELGSIKRTLEATRGELRQAQDALAESQAAELEARTELLAWQEGDAGRRYA